MPVFGISSTAINKPFKSITGFDNNNQTSTNVAAPASAADAVPLSYLQNAANLTTGTLAASITPAYTGDVTKSAGSLTLTLSTTGVAAGTYKSVTVDAKGRITDGSNPTTLAGFGITDAYTSAQVDSAISAATPTFSTLSGKPTTLAGYGITDGATTAYVDAKTWAFSSITSKPTTLSGYGITDAITSAAVASAYLPLSGGTLTGDLTFSGTGRRIIGDFSNATTASRAAFQTSTANSFTNLGALPSGSGTTASFNFWNSSDIANSSWLQVTCNSTIAGITSGINGTGTALPLVFTTNAAERMRVDTAGKLLIGTTGAIGGSAANNLQLLGTSTTTGISLGSSTQPAASGDVISSVNFWGYDSVGYYNSGIISSIATQAWNSNARGSGLAFSVIATGRNSTPYEAVRINSSGQLLVGLTTPADAGDALIASAGPINALGPNMNPGGSSGDWMRAAFSTNGSYGGGIALIDGTTAGFGMYVDTSGSRFVFGAGTSTSALSNILNIRNSGDVNVNNTTTTFYNTNGAGDVGGAYPLRIKGANSNSTTATLGENNGAAYVSGFRKNASSVNIAMGHVAFYTDSTTAGAEVGHIDITAKASGSGAFGGNGLRIQAGTAGITPTADNAIPLGGAALRWSVVYAGTGTINTSDAREKTEVVKLSDAELIAAQQIADEIGSYKWLASVKEKGDTARTHIGLTVQRAIEILEANKLVAADYGFICFDEWEESTDADGNVLHPAGNRYGFRYDELNTFIAAGLNQKMKAFEARLAALEGK